MLSELIQIIGSILILIAFTLLQLRKTSSHARMYLLLNIIGSTILAVNALLGHQWGFVLLESVWALVSLASLFSLPTTPSNGRVS